MRRFFLGALPPKNRHNIGQNRHNIVLSTSHDSFEFEMIFCFSTYSTFDVPGGYMNSLNE